MPTEAASSRRPRVKQVAIGVVCLAAVEALAVFWAAVSVLAIAVKDGLGTSHLFLALGAALDSFAGRVPLAITVWQNSANGLDVYALVAACYALAMLSVLAGARAAGWRWRGWPR